MPSLREILLELLENGEVRIQNVQRLLGEVSHRETRSEADTAVIGMSCARDHL